jgi:hypothetical protein
MRAFQSLLFASAFALSSVGAAQAVVIEAGVIETNGNVATVDLIYFTLSDVGDSIISMSPFCGSCGVITTERSGIALYSDDGAGGVGSLIEIDSGDAASVASGIDRLVIDGDDLAVGNYVLAVSWISLDPGELGATQIDANVDIAFDYEVGFSGSAATNAVITCTIDGNLDGSFTVDRRDSTSNCTPPRTVDEPSTLALLSLSLFGLLGLKRRASVQ